MLQKTFTQLSSKYNSDEQLTKALWREIETKHSSKKRHYHTLQHLENLLHQLTTVKSDISHWNTVLFTLFYHDIVYNPLKSDNEEKSAEFAERSMLQMSVPSNIIENCKAQIVATRQHLDSPDQDTNYFLDADLSVLGQDWATYSAYYNNVRKEYAIYPDMLYKPGRKKVLRHFLGMDRIFKTAYFYAKFEQEAKQNLKKELELLS